MIRIYQPETHVDREFTTISSYFSCSAGNDRLWYKFPSRFQEYLVHEQLDAMVVGLLFSGLKTGEDIRVEGPLSAKLFYTLNHYVIKALCFSNKDLKPIKVIAEKLSYKNLNTANISGTGVSCGVDSLATYCDHLDEPDPYKIGCFTYFNVGSHGDFGGEKARMKFKERLEHVQKFADETGKEIISVDSNLSELLAMKFQQTYTLRIASCVLLLQKKFRNYYYATGTRFDHFSMNMNEIADMDMLLLPNLSTESLTFYPTALQYNRIERTELISNFPVTYNYLDVCVNLSKDKKYINCSTCYKCMRTQMTLELLGKLHLYRNVFDLELYSTMKDKHLGWLLSKEKKLTLDEEFINFLKKKKHRLSHRAYLHVARFYFYRFRKRYFRL